MPMPGDQYKDTPATVNPFVTEAPQQRVSDFTAQEIATLQGRLEKQLGPEYISTRPGAGGGKVHYLAAEKVINLANEVFGFNGWSSSIREVQVDFVDEHPQNGKITLGLSIIVRVTLKDGTFHEDVGYGHIENCKGKAAAFEKAKKEAATDALKRALRTFGNVLGNCLYDKDYLQKVTKVKSGPSRWDADNLHRHPDFAPIKQQSIVEAETQHNQALASRRATSLQSGMSFGSAEFEDDFGGNVFDDMDFNHPDEIRLDNSAVAAATNPAHRSMNPPQHPAHGGMQRMHSMPQLQGPAIQPQQPNSNHQQSLKPSMNERHMAGAPQSRPPPQTARAPIRQPQFSGLPPHIGTDGNPTKSTPSSGSSTAEPPSHPAQQGNGNFVNKDLHEEQDSILQKQPPPGAPAGFITGRSADMLNKIPEGRPAVTGVAPFNPHAESPSIRRTSGVNPGKSAAITREALQKAVGSSQQIAASTGNGLNGQTTPVRTNFVNPSADTNRRIGMPPGATGGSMQNRSMYRPPTAVKRPALTDVSNLQQVDGASEVKKPRLDISPQKPNNVQDAGG